GDPSDFYSSDTFSQRSSRMRAACLLVRDRVDDLGVETQGVILSFPNSVWEHRLPKLRFGPARAGGAKRSFAGGRSQTEFGNESDGASTGPGIQSRKNLNPPQRPSHRPALDPRTHSWLDPSRYETPGP